MRSVTGNGAVTFIVLLLLAVLTTPAAASGKNGPKNPPGKAKFEGRQINLQRGWGDARTCVVWNEDGETDCFRAEQAADAAIARRERAEARATTKPAIAAPVTGGPDLHAASLFAPRGAVSLVAPHVVPAELATCASWLTLYEHTNHDGRSLRFRDIGTTQDLASWGFASQTSSYRVGACGVVLRDAGGTVYPGWTGAHASTSSMLSGWNDRVRYLRIR